VRETVKERIFLQKAREREGVCERESARAQSRRKRREKAHEGQ